MQKGNILVNAEKLLLLVLGVTIFFICSGWSDSSVAFHNCRQRIKGLKNRRCLVRKNVNLRWNGESAKKDYLSKKESTNKS